MVNADATFFVSTMPLVLMVLLIFSLIYCHQIHKLIFKHFDKKQPFAWYLRQVRVLEYCQTHAPELKLYEYSRSLILLRQLVLLALGVGLAISVALMIPSLAVALTAYHFWIFAILVMIALTFATVSLQLHCQKVLVDFIKSRHGELFFPKAWHLDGAFDLAVHQQLCRYYKALLVIVGIIFVVYTLYVVALIQLY